MSKIGTFLKISKVGRFLTISKKGKFPNTIFSKIPEIGTFLKIFQLEDFRIFLKWEDF